MKYLLLILLCFTGCSTLSDLGQSMSDDVMTPPQKSVPVTSIWDRQTWEVQEDPQWKVTSEKFITDSRWDDEKEIAHYHLNRVESKFGTYYLQYSYDDNEDGGNSYGWVLDMNKKKIGRIEDSFLYEGIK